MSQELNTLVAMYDKEKGKNPEWDRDVLAAIQESMSQINEGQINQDRGASAGVRMAVGAARTPDERLATMRNYYPEAIPYGEDNFLAINRRNNQPFLYNPPGLGLDDIPEYTREIVTAGAGIGAAVLTSPAATTGVGAAAPYVAGGLASAGAGSLYDAAMESMFDTVDTRTLGEQAEDYIMEAGLGMLPVDKLGAPVSNFFRKAVIDPSKEAVREVVEKYGIQPTAGTVGNGLLQSLEAGSQRIGAAMSSFKQSADEMYEGIERVIDDFFEGAGGRTSSIDAGRNAVEKGRQFVDDFTKQSEVMYGAVDDFIPADTLIMPSNFEAAAKQMQFSSKLGQLFQSDRAAKIVNILAEDGPVPYAELAKIRSALGKIIGNKSKVAPGDIDVGEAKQLYSAITRDMEEAAKSQGDEAFEAWQAANEFYKTGSKTINEVIYPTMTTGKGREWLDPLSTFSNISKLVSGNPDALSRLKTSGVLDQDDMGQIGAGVLRDLGQGTKASVARQQGDLSPARILAQTTEDVIHEESKDVLFNMKSVEILDDLRTLGAAVKQTDELVNRSNTGNAGMIGALTTGLGTAIATQDAAQAMGVALGTIVLPYLGSKGLQSKPFINWVTKGAKEGAGEEWVRAGARMAAKEGLMEAYDAVVEFTSGNTGAADQNRGMLFE